MMEQRASRDTKGKDPEVAVTGQTPCRVGPLEVGWCHSEHGLLVSPTAAFPSMRTLWSPLPGWRLWGMMLVGGPDGQRAPFHCGGARSF